LLTAMPPRGTASSFALALRQKVAWPDAERLCQAGDIEHGDVALAALDTADVVAMQSAAEGELFLRPAALGSQEADALADEDEDAARFGAAEFHAAHHTYCVPTALHTISVMYASGDAWRGLELRDKHEGKRGFLEESIVWPIVEISRLRAWE